MTVKGSRVRGHEVPLDVHWRSRSAKTATVRGMARGPSSIHEGLILPSERNRIVGAGRTLLAHHSVPKPVGSAARVIIPCGSLSAPLLFLR